MTKQLKNKNWFYVVIFAITAFLFSGVASASYTYSRSPAGATINAGSAVVFNLVGDIADLNGGDASCVNLELWLKSERDFTSLAQFPITNGFNKNFIWTANTIGNFFGIKIVRTKADGFTRCGTDTYVEGDGNGVMFSVIDASPTPAPTAGILFTVSNDTQGYRDMVAGDNYAEHYKPTTNQTACLIRQKVEVVGHIASSSPNASLDWTVYQGANIETATQITGNASETFASMSWVSSLPYYKNFLMPNCATLTAGLDYWFIFYSNHLYTSNEVLRIYKRNSVQSSQSGAWLKPYGAGSFSAIAGDWSFQLSTDTTITGGASGTFAPPSTVSYGFESRDFGVIGNYFRDVIVWLFFPNQDNLNQFANLYQTIQNKPPIGYFTQIKSLFTNLNTGTADITLSMTPFALILSPLRVGLSVILWFMLAFWLLHRFRQFIL